jgi:hypothetical protein
MDEIRKIELIERPDGTYDLRCVYCKTIFQHGLTLKAAMWNGPLHKCEQSAAEQTSSPK